MQAHNWDIMYAYSLPVGLRIFYIKQIVERLNAEHEARNQSARESAKV